MKLLTYLIFGSNAPGGSGASSSHINDLKLRNGTDFFLLRTGSPNRLQLGH